MIDARLDCESLSGGTTSTEMPGVSTNAVNTGATKRDPFDIFTFALLAEIRRQKGEQCFSYIFDRCRSTGREALARFGVQQAQQGRRFNMVVLYDWWDRVIDVVQGPQFLGWYLTRMVELSHSQRLNRLLAWLRNWSINLDTVFNYVLIHNFLVSIDVACMTWLVSPTRYIPQ